MLFNSYIFLLAFLPITLAVFRALEQGQRRRAALVWLVVASLFFYAWWNPPYLWLMLFSLGFNYACGRGLSRAHQASTVTVGKLLLVFAVTANLALLGYYKYWNFLVENVSRIFDRPFSPVDIFLPLGISFFTFQQIAFLVDAWRGETKEYDAVQYSLFVTFFPQLIAGPIVHHKDVLPQFRERPPTTFRSTTFAAGLCLLAIGLAKKVVIADTFAPAAADLFGAAAEGPGPPFLESWMGVLAYTLQIYFDFSGYSDMAVGLGWLFGINLALNFQSPYRATSIIEFWRRWHMTLSRFLRDYLYVPLGGSRRGPTRHLVNIMITMLLGGLWHGANWTFVVWGGLHGVFLVVNHLWRRARGLSAPRTFGRAVAGQALTLLCICLGWVFFRADSMGTAFKVLRGMCGGNGWGRAPGALESALLLGALALATTARDSMSFMTARAFVRHPEVASLPPGVPEPRFAWAPTPRWAVAGACLGLLGLLFLVRDVAVESPFLYFQF